MATPLPKKHSMSALKSKILQPSLTSHYEVYFTPPSAVRSYLKSQSGITVSGEETEDKITVPCSEATLPGSRYATHELKDDYTGITQKHAHRRLYDDSINFTFYVDAQEYYIIRYIEGWMGYIMQENLAVRGNGAVPNVDGNNYSHRMAFPRSYYASEMSVTKFERDYNIQSGKLIYNFKDAFPLGLSAMPVSYDSSQLMKCTVEFQFSRYVVNRVNNGGTKKQVTITV